MERRMTRNQHYVPQFYLRNFTDDTEMLWIYNRLQDRVCRSRPKDICREDFLYETEWKNANVKLGNFLLPNHLEKIFSYQEKEYSNVLNEIFKVCKLSCNNNALICSMDEKEILAGFISNLLLRNPWIMKLFMQEENEYELIKNEELKNIDELLKSMRFGGFESFCEAAKMRIILDERFEGGISKYLKDEIRKMNLSILRAEEVDFITSEFPVIYETTDNDENVTEITSIYLPISSKFALLYSKSSLSKCYRNRLISIDKRSTIKMNYSYFNQKKEQSNYIIAKDKKNLDNIITEARKHIKKNQM